jgi:hypothetical protein
MTIMGRYHTVVKAFHSVCGVCNQRLWSTQLEGSDNKEFDANLCCSVIARVRAPTRSAQPDARLRRSKLQELRCYDRRYTGQYLGVPARERQGRNPPILRSARPIGQFRDTPMFRAAARAYSSSHGHTN